MRGFISSIAVAVICLVSAQPPAQADEVVYIPKEKVAMAMTNQAVLTSGPDHSVMILRREEAGRSEVHTDDTDIFYVLDGSATFVTGGEVTGGEPTGPGQVRGDGITGGQTHTLSKGDIIVVPKGTPHWFKQVPVVIVYLTVKATQPRTAIEQR